MDTLSQDRPRVLIVDDQPNWLEALCDVLDPKLYEIETATSYDEAKRKLRQRAFHVVVTDQRLVDADESNIQGIYLLDEVSGFQDGTQAIIVTGYPTIKAAKEALRGRHAYDYILKYPEEGGPFNIRQYRERVEEAAKKAIEARKKAITLDFSVSTLVEGLTYDRIAEMLFSEGAMPQDASEIVRKVTNKLLYPLQPLTREMGRVWLSQSDRMCELLCWSRNRGQAILLRVGRKQSPLAGHMMWVSNEEGYALRKREQYASAPGVGVSYAVDDMTFEDFAALVGEG